MNDANDENDPIRNRLRSLPRHAAPPALMRTLNHAFLDAPAPRRTIGRWFADVVPLRPVAAFAASVVVLGLVAVGVQRNARADKGMDVDALLAAHMRYQAENLVPSADPSHADMSAQLVKYYADED